MSNTVIFKVEDMTCGHCVKTITNAINAAFPVAQVTANLSSHEVTVSGVDDKRKIAEIIEEEGYTPKQI